MFDHKAVGQLLEEDPDEAFRLLNDHLRDNSEDAKALFMVGVIMSRAERYSTALPVFERCVKLAPHRAESWNGLGMVHLETHKPVEAREAFKRALSIKEDAMYMGNIACTYLNENNYPEAIRWCNKALKKDPEHAGAKATLGFSHLAIGNWKDGWAGFESNLGGKFRMSKNFTGEPKWDGAPVGSLVIYGEQGLGDEIMYASILADAQKLAKVTLECDPRLEGLFRRSFPAIEVHGTRRVDADWAEGRQFDAGSAIGSLAHLFRKDPKDCPRVPYLHADPERRLQWRALFDTWKKPVIGLCWAGGRANTQRTRRAVGLEAFRSLIESTEAEFVSLQYKDPTAEIAETGLPVRHYARAVQSQDYDDTAAFVAECDLVLGIHTTVHHLAGALGVPSIVLVPSKPMWNYAHGETLPWYGSPLHRQRKDESWADCVKRLDISAFAKVREHADH